jgi:hypothetical protein
MEEANQINSMQQSNSGIRYLEEKQRILKDRLILIGQNLLEIKDKSEKEILELKKEMELLRQSNEKIQNFLEKISSQISSFAKKDDLDILKKQAKMFQPLNFLTKHDLEKLKKK